MVYAALAFMAASSAFAAPVTYKEAAAPWSLEQALRLAPALTPEVLKSFEPAAAEKLAAKQREVSGLLKRYAVCALNAEDQKTSEKHLSKEFQAEIKHYANGGCAALKAGEAAYRPAPQAASLEAVSALSASGSFATAQGAARFYDGASGGGSAALPVAAGAGAAAPAAAYTAQPAKASPLSSNVPQLRAQAPERARPVVPEGLGQDGMVNTAVAYWSAMRRQNVAAIRSGDLEGAEKAKAYLKAAAAVGFGGLLFYSNLSNVEVAAARLRWAVQNDAGGRVVAAEAGKFAFHSAIFILAFAPIPMVKVAQAALAGEAWALAVVAAIAVGPIDRYITHIADVKQTEKP